MKRKQLIEWLATNDPNGVYRDKDSKREFGNKLSKKEAKVLYKKQKAGL